MSDAECDEGVQSGNSSVTSTVKKRVSRRRRVKRAKERGKYVPKPKPLSNGDPDLASCIFSDDEIQVDYIVDHVSHIADTGEIQEEAGRFTSVDFDHDYCVPSTSASESDSLSSESRPTSACSSASLQSDESRPPSSVGLRPPSAGSGDLPQSPAPTVNVSFSPSPTCISSVLTTLKALLPLAWIPIFEGESFHLLYLSDTTPKAVQREVVVSCSGKVKVFVHRKSVDDKVLSKCRVIPLSSEDNSLINNFSEQCVKVVHGLMIYDVCVGADHIDTKQFWSLIPDSYVDLNPYSERGYSESCRSTNCKWLVKGELGKMSRCTECHTIMKSLKRRQKTLTADTAAASTRNDFLTPGQLLQKSIGQGKKIKKKDKQIAYLRKKIDKLLEDEGVDIEEDLNSALVKALRTTKLSPMMEEFLTAQVESAGKKNATLRRWHPSMIRYALYLQSNMTRSGYEGLRDSGCLILPSVRTLYDYSHVIEKQEGVSDGILQVASDKVDKLPLEYQKYHTLLCDEMYISKNLVYKRSNHSLVGYSKLSAAEKEVKEFEAYVEKQFSGKDQDVEPELARTVLAYLVKGVGTDVKYIVAIYPIKDLSADMLYKRTWEVIARLEKAGLKVLALVCDGSPINRAFINMHVPITKTKTNVIFDTLNFVSPEGRPLFFVSDVCHLLKTIRNCLYNSGDTDKKPRCMQINGQKLEWKHIVRLSLNNKHHNFRKAYKLNAQNVFPNSYSVMRVRYAAEVMSNTVAKDIEELNWEGTSELVRFIRYINKFFDVFNGAYYMQHIRTKNKDLAPFESADDPRFDWLGVPNPDSDKVSETVLTDLPFLDYLEEWTKQVQGLSVPAKQKEKMLLARQTLHGIEMATRGIAGAMRFMFALKERPKYIMARAFSQDPLEQTFSRIRASVGSGGNPNVDRTLGAQVALTVQRGLGVRVKRGNVSDPGEAGPSNMKVNNEPLPKRARSSKKKLS